MPRRRVRSPRRQRIELQSVAIDLIAGPLIRLRYPNPEDPRTEWERQARIEELREPYWRFREELLAAVPAGMRPWAWWQFERGEPRPPADAASQARRLAELGELTENERARLKAAARIAPAYGEIWDAVRESS
jgi:hypothetical protein